jgi:hypothetical protein
MISLLWSSGLWLPEFRETCYLHIHIQPKATGSAFFPKVSNHLPHYWVPYVTQLQRKRFTTLCYGKKEKTQSSLIPRRRASDGKIKMSECRFKNGNAVKSNIHVLSEFLWLLIENCSETNNLLILEGFKASK